MHATVYLYNPKWTQFIFLWNAESEQHGLLVGLLEIPVEDNLNNWPTVKTQMIPTV